MTTTAHVLLTGLPGCGKTTVVCRVVELLKNRRLGELELAGLADYGSHLETHPEEWPRLDALCRISISHFYRDRSVFDCLRDDVLPALAEGAIASSENQVRCWSIGCASGEERRSRRS